MQIYFQPKVLSNLGQKEQLHKKHTLVYRTFYWKIFKK